jgi:hypothetical protein
VESSTSLKIPLRFGRLGALRVAGRRWCNRVGSGAFAVLEAVPVTVAVAEAYCARYCGTLIVAQPLPGAANCSFLLFTETIMFLAEPLL